MPQIMQSVSNSEQSGFKDPASNHDSDYLSLAVVSSHRCSTHSKDGITPEIQKELHVASSPRPCWLVSFRRAKAPEGVSPIPEPLLSQTADSFIQSGSSHMERYFHSYQ